MSYFDSNVPTHYQTSYDVVDDKGKVINEYRMAPCFSAISAYAIPKEAKKIVFIREKTSSPYKEKEIKRWVDDCNEIGFTSKLIVERDRYLFEVDIGEYTYKEHLVATLMLVRSLFESGHNRVPECYFNIMDKEPNADKFIAIQRAHKEYQNSNQHEYQNSNHMITAKNNGPGNVTKATLFSRWKRSNTSVYVGENRSYHRTTYFDKWAGKVLPGDPDGPIAGHEPLLCNECNYGH